MATHSAGGKRPDVRPALATLADDAEPDAVRLQGYVGPTKNDKTMRLYSSFEDLSEYVDVPRDDVLRSAAAPEAMAPNGGVYAWVKPDAQLVYTRTQSTTAIARDLGAASARDAQLATELRRRNPGATVLATLTAGASAVAFVEFRPGLTGVVESAPAGQSAKTDALRGRALGSIYSELSKLPVPPAVLRAGSQKMDAPSARAPQPPQVRASGSEAPPAAGHVLPATPAEQAWFNATFCNGAHICVQAWELGHLRQHLVQLI